MQSGRYVSYDFFNFYDDYKSGTDDHKLWNRKLRVNEQEDAIFTLGCPVHLKQKANNRYMKSERKVKLQNHRNDIRSGYLTLIAAVVTFSPVVPTLFPTLPFHLVGTPGVIGLKYP